MERYYQKEIECASQEQIKAWQDERLVRQVRHVWDKVPYYRAKMEEKGVTPEDIHGRDDLYKLPFLSKADLRDAYPYRSACRAAGRMRPHPLHLRHDRQARRRLLHQGGYRPLERLLRKSAGGRGRHGPEDVCQVAYGYGLFTGGFGLNGGSQKLGCLTLPMSSGNTDRQLQFMEDLGSTILCCTPSYAAYLAESIHERGLQDKIHLKAGIFGAEAWSEQMRQDIQKSLGIKAYDIYGLTELSGPGVAYECSAQTGMHINEDHFIAEIIDPDTGEVLPEGTQGELVFTSITKQAFPLLRYRTRDICVLRREACPCGRTHIKMCKPMGRSDDMLIVKGVNVFPSQIETVLLEQGYTSNYQIVVDRVNNSDTLDVLVEMTPDHFSDSLAEITKREKGLVAALKAMLGIYAQVHLVSPKSIARSEGKAIRVIDKRKI